MRHVGSGAEDVHYRAAESLLGIRLQRSGHHAGHGGGAQPDSGGGRHGAFQPLGNRQFAAAGERLGKAGQAAPLHAFSRAPLRSVAFGHHAPGTKKSCQTSLHSSIIFRPYSLRPRSSGPVLFVPKVNLQPDALAILTNDALGSLYRSLSSMAT